MLQTLIATFVILAIGVFGMCFNIIFRKNGKFPETEISRNENMRKLGIKCMREQDEEIFSQKKPQKNGVCSGEFSDSCIGCGLYDIESKSRKEEAGADGQCGKD
jgi:hypothetical protein